ncbi:MAG: hypothetical protein FD166_918 [Bacteroidetes bacterium]|nr:MAG: hypothetical protein FD166_918 [Bacteroidota bacterium]
MNRGRLYEAAFPEEGYALYLLLRLSIFVLMNTGKG